MALKKNGPETIDKIVGQFQGIVDGLDKGVELCNTQQDRNNVVMDKLKNENDFLNDKTETAKNFRDNLRNMMIPPSKKKKKDNE